MEMQDERWRVLRVDDKANQFIVARDMSEVEARALVSQLTGRARKQQYRAEPMPALRAQA